MCKIMDDFNQTAFFDYLKKEHNFCIYRHTFSPGAKKILYDFFFYFIS
jgi:hypothetical protein